MRKGFFILIAIVVCALAQSPLSAQSPDSSAGTAITSPVAVRPLTAPAPAVNDLQARLDEGRQLLKSHPTLVNTNTVVLAVLDRDTSKIDLIPVQKDSFLTKGAHLLL